MLDDRTWLLIGRKMANEASLQELHELEEILRANPELHFSLQTLSDLWQQSPNDDSEELHLAYARLLDSLNAKGSDVPGVEQEEPVNLSITTRRKKTFLTTNNIAAAVLSIAAIAVIWIANPFVVTKAKAVADREPASEISTRYGSKTNIVLPDGSKVWLNAGSKITYDKEFGESVRNVQLTGEAYFDVVHNPEKPFVIHTRAMDIKVLGTEFNVKSYPDEKTTETSLIRGSIEITLKDRKSDRIILKPNEKLIVSNETLADSIITAKKSKAQAQRPIISLSKLNYFSLDSTIMETSWVNNRLIFEDESFEEIAMKMTRWYGARFYFEDDEVKKMRFTGNFKDENLDDALQAMQITADFKYTITDKNVTITKH